MFSLFCACNQAPLPNDQIDGIHPATAFRLLGAGLESAYSIRPTADGGYILTGFDAAGNIALVKLDERADVVWRQSFDQSASDFASAVNLAADGGYVIAGRTSSGSNNLEALLIKTDAGGMEEWSRNFGPDAVQAEALVATADSGYVFVGTAAENDPADLNMLIVRTDAAGSEVWSRVIDETPDDRAWSIAEAGPDEFVVLGTSAVTGAAVLQLHLTKIDLAGEVLWSKTFTGVDETPFRHRVLPTQDGGFALLSTRRNASNNDADLLLIKVDSDGQEVWSNTYGGPVSDQGHALVETADGGFLLLGGTQSYGNGVTDLLLIRTDALGEEIWTRAYGGENYDAGWDLARRPGGGFIVCGTTQGTGGGVNFDMIILLTDAEGIPE